MGIETQAILCAALSAFLAGWIIVDILSLHLMCAPGFVPIAMDGAACLKTKDNRIVIKPRTLINWLAVIILGACEIGLFVVTITALISLLNGKGMLGQIGLVCGAFIIVGIALFAAARSLRQSSFYLDINTQLLITGHGTHARQIPFSNVQRVDVSSPTSTGISHRAVKIVRCYIRVKLKGGKTIKIGSVSGEERRVKTSAKAIAELIGSATGAQVRGVQV